MIFKRTYVAPDIAWDGAWIGTGWSSISIDILTVYLDFESCR